jgi:hypothetical protein
MVSRAIALGSLFAVFACSNPEEMPEQSGGGVGGSSGGSAGTLLPGTAAGESGGLSIGGQGGGGAGTTIPGAAGGVTTPSGGATGVAGRGGSVAASGSPASGGNVQVATGGAGTGGAPPSAGAGGAEPGGAQGVRGGEAGGGGAGGGGAGDGAGGSGASDEPFQLAWQDDFDTLDSSAWQLQTFTWDGNQAQFSAQNASVSNGVLTIALTAAPSGSEKPYLGVEMRSTKTLTFGKVSARMRFAKGSGVVSGLVLFHTPFPNCDWNEIDIEHLGKSSNSSQLNAMVYTGTPDPSCTTSVTPTQDPQVADLGFNTETDFHSYDIEWTPAGVRYFADGVLLRTWTANIALLKLPANILLTIWASGSADWAGALTSTSAPTNAEVDWIKVYTYDAPTSSTQ